MAPERPYAAATGHGPISCPHRGTDRLGLTPDHRTGWIPLHRKRP